MSLSEALAIEEYISEALRQGFINHLIFSTSAGIFIVEKKDVSLKSCTGYEQQLFIKAKKCLCHLTIVSFLEYILYHQGRVEEHME
ncbi:hypothetical protein P4O66_011858, partial [Electrophorus voltai]